MRLEQPELGRAIRERRQAARLTQRALAEAAQIGNSPRDGADYLSKVERGERGLDLESIERIAAALRVPRSVFLVPGGPDEAVIAGQVQREVGGGAPPTGRSRAEQLVDVLAAAMAEGLSLEGAERVADREFEMQGFSLSERHQVRLAFEMTRRVQEGVKNVY
jgi:transcriptional regulator with XRE-family HTH domain